MGAPASFSDSMQMTALLGVGVTSYGRTLNPSLRGVSKAAITTTGRCDHGSRLFTPFNPALTCHLLAQNTP